MLDGTRAHRGKRSLVVGGGMVGCEIAALLGEQEHEVDVIELRGEIGADVIREHKIYLMKDFEQYRIGQITGAKVCRFYKDGVEYRKCRRYQTGSTRL
ncbi:MAG: FAD-dependent oxidoreductase [Clostridium sp.]